jgi:hypothetical protein
MRQNERSPTFGRKKQRRLPREHLLILEASASDFFGNYWKIEKLRSSFCLEQGGV